MFLSFPSTCKRLNSQKFNGNVSKFFEHFICCRYSNVYPCIHLARVLWWFLLNRRVCVSPCKFESGGYWSQEFHQHFEHLPSNITISTWRSLRPLAPGHRLGGADRLRCVWSRRPRVHRRRLGSPDFHNGFPRHFFHGSPDCQKYSWSVLIRCSGYKKQSNIFLHICIFFTLELHIINQFIWVHFIFSSNFISPRQFIFSSNSVFFLPWTPFAPPDEVARSRALPPLCPITESSFVRTGDTQGPETRDATMWVFGFDSFFCPLASIS